MADTEQATEQATVSREAHQRMTDERNQYKEKVDELTKTLTQMTVNDKARQHFEAHHVENPSWAADIAVPDVVSAGVELDQLTDYLDKRFNNLYRDEGTPPSTPPGEDPNVPVLDAAEPPSFAKPTPASEGAPPGAQTYTIDSPEIKALIAANDRDKIVEMDKAGLIEWRTAPPVMPG